MRNERKSELEKIRKHFIFHGNFQGVGFRYTACYTARNYGISGWVKNLDDGSVEMEAEGRSADIDALVHSLEQLRWGYVERIDSKLIPIHGDYDFEIV